MNIIIHSKHYLVPEFIYVSNQILKEWFGLEVTILPSKSDFIELSFQGLPNKFAYLIPFSKTLSSTRISLNYLYLKKSLNYLKNFKID